MTSQKNICRVARESDVNKITKEKQDILILVLYNYPSPSLNIFMKRHLSRQFEDCFFVLASIDDNFVSDLKKYDVNTFPYVEIYHNDEICATINMAEPTIIIDTLHKIILQKEEIEKGKVEEMREKIKEKVKNPQEILKEKMNSAREYQIKEMSKNGKIHELIVLEKLRDMKKKNNNEK